MAKKMKTIFAIAIFVFMSVAGAIPFGTNTEDREAVKELESLLELQEIADPSRSDATDELAERFADTPYNNKMNDPGFDPDLDERSDGIAYHELNDPIRGEEGEEEIADPSRSDVTDELAERFSDTPYNDKMNDPGFDPNLDERSDGIAYHKLNDPIHGEEGEEGEAEDEEGDESGSGVNPKPSKPPKKFRFCNKCCKESKRPKFCRFICLKKQACPKPSPSGRGGRGGKGRPRDDPQSAHFIEDESTGRY